MNKNNVDKKMSAKDDKSLAKDIQDIEFDISGGLYDRMRSDYQDAVDKGYSGNFMSWVQSQPDNYFKRIELNSGGKVISFSDYVKKNPKVKKINLADHFKLNQTVADLSDADVELVNRLLKMSLGKED
jgi:hypothetical protein